MKLKVKKGDTVVIRSGKDKGKSGKIIKAFPAEQLVLVEGINLKKVHERARKQGEKGKIVERSYPVRTSIVALIDPKKAKPTRVRIERKDGKRVRIAVKSGSKLD